MRIDPPRNIARTDTRLERTSFGAGTILFSLPFVAVGGFFCWAGFIDLTIIDDANAPLWVLGSVGAIFLLAGAVLMARGIAGAFRQYSTERRRAQYPDEPWRWDYPWSAGGVYDAAMGRIIKGALGCGLMAIFLVPFIWWGWLSGEGGAVVQGVTGLFAAIWLIALGTWCYRLFQFAKYGTTKLWLDQFPMLTGTTAEVGFNNQHFRDLTLTLRFVEERYVRRGSGRQRTVSHECLELYEERFQMQGTPGRFHTLRFDVPNDPELTNGLIANPAIRYWELVVEAEVPGLDFRTTFPLPIYHAPHSKTTSNGQFEVRRMQRSDTRLSFEAKFFGIPLALLLMALLLAPERVTGPLQSVSDRAITFWQLRPDSQIGTDVMDIHATDDSIWVVGKYDLTEFREDGSRQEHLNHQRFQQVFGHKMNALASVYVTANGDVWVGSWYGDIFRESGGEWRELISREASPVGRIRGFLEADGDLLVLGQGIWHWHENERRLTSVVPDIREARAATFHAGSWYVGADNRLGRLTDEGVDWIYTADANVEALASTDGETLLLGTRRSLTRVSPDGGSVRIADVPAVSLAYSPSMLAAGTVRTGLTVIRDDHLIQLDATDGMPSLNVTDLVIWRGELWIACYGGGLSRISTDLLGRMLSRKSPQSDSHHAVSM